MSSVQITTQYLSGPETIYVLEPVDLSKIIGFVLYVTPGLWKIEVIAKHPGLNRKFEYGATSECIAQLMARSDVRILKIIANDSKRFISELSKVIELVNQLKK